MKRSQDRINLGPHDFSQRPNPHQPQSDSHHWPVLPAYSSHSTHKSLLQNLENPPGPSTIILQLDLEMENTLREPDFFAQ